MRKPGDPPLVPLFPIDLLTPRSPCPHHGPIPNGTVLCCMVCHRSGVDTRPALKRDPRTDPKPEPKTEVKPPAKLTRRERRSLAKMYAREPDAREFLEAHAIESRSCTVS